jgi:elongation factor Ts
VHIAFAKPQYLSRDEVPEEVVAEERETLLGITRAEGKPEAAWSRIVDGRLDGWYKERVLLDQAFVRDDKQTVAELAASGRATVARFAQLYIGG